MDAVSARLLVSLSGIRPATLDGCLRLTEELDARGVRASLLVVPRAPGPVDWLRHRRDGGDAIVLHGYDHTADPTRARGSRIGRRAEFATLPSHEAGLRLLAADTLLERLGLRTDAFAPPRWLASPGTLRALRSAAFRVCADATAVRDLPAGLAHRGRVLGFGGAHHVEPWWCRAMVLGAARAARRGGLVRVAVDAADLSRDARRGALLDAVDIALHHGARPETYAALPAGLALAA